MNIIPYKQAKQLNKIGFNIYLTLGNVTSLYNKDGVHTPYTNYGVMYSGLSGNYISAPTYEQVFKWFRTKHKLSAWSYQYKKNECGYVIYSIKGVLLKTQAGNIKTVEEAEEECLIQLIKLHFNLVNRSIKIKEQQK